MTNYYVFGVEWTEFVSWFLAQPLYGQIIIGVGIVAILALIITGVYYILKGVAYLIYYILKGLYYLFKGLCISVYKLFKELYHLISGKSSQKAQPQMQVMPMRQEPAPLPPSQRVIRTIRQDASFCSECGATFTNRMIQELAEKGKAFCFSCGNGFSVEQHQSMKVPTNVEG